MYIYLIENNFKLILKYHYIKMFRSKSIKMLVCDMSGTTIQERGIVYNSLYNTINL